MVKITVMTVFRRNSASETFVGQSTQEMKLFWLKMNTRRVKTVHWLRLYITAMSRCVGCVLEILELNSQLYIRLFRHQAESTKFKDRCTGQTDV